MNAQELLERQRAIVRAMEELIRETARAALAGELEDDELDELDEDNDDLEDDDGE